MRTVFPLAGVPLTRIVRYFSALLKSSVTTCGRGVQSKILISKRRWETCIHSYQWRWRGPHLPWDVQYLLELWDVQSRSLREFTWSLEGVFVYRRGMWTNSTLLIQFPSSRISSIVALYTAARHGPHGKQTSAGAHDSNFGLSRLVFIFEGFKFVITVRVGDLVLRVQFMGLNLSKKGKRGSLLVDKICCFGQRRSRHHWFRSIVRGGEGATLKFLLLLIRKTL